MKTTIHVVPTVAFETFRLATNGTWQLAVQFDVRADEGNRVEVVSGGSLDELDGHVRFEYVAGDPINPTWGKVVYFPASDDVNPAFGIEVRAPREFVTELASRLQRGKLPARIIAEVEGLEPDFTQAGSAMRWRWDPVQERELSVLSLGWSALLTDVDAL